MSRQRTSASSRSHSLSADCGPASAPPSRISPRQRTTQSDPSPPAHQAARDSAHPAAVEQQRHLVLALLSRVGDGPRVRRGPGTLKDGYEAIDVDGWTAVHATRQCRGVCVGARAVTVKGPSHGVRSLPISAASNSSSVAHPEHRVDAARVELRLPVGLRRRERLPRRRLHRAHPLRVVRRFEGLAAVEAPWPWLPW